MERDRESKCLIRRKSKGRKREGERNRVEKRKRVREREREREGERERGRKVHRLVCVRVYAERLSNFLPVTMRSY